MGFIASPLNMYNYEHFSFFLTCDNVIGGRLLSREMRQISVRAGRAGMFLEDAEQEGGGVKKS